MIISKKVFGIICCLGCALGVAYACYIAVSPKFIDTSSSASRAELEKLRSLPYARWVPAEKTKHLSGVTTYDVNGAYAGLNFYNSTLHPSAFLLDMTGNILHKWKPKVRSRAKWQHATLLMGGEFVAVAKDAYIAKIDWNSKVHWSRPGRYHHDVSVRSDGTLHTLRREERIIQLDDTTLPVLDDRIDVLSMSGDLLNSHSVFDLVGDQVPPERLRAAHEQAARMNLAGLKVGSPYHGRRLIENSPFDVLHTNTVFSLEEDFAGVCKKNDLLISVREINLIGCADLNSMTMRWQWGPGILDKQHHPTLLKNGHILVFDNRSDTTRHSRAVEIDPQSGAIIWEAPGANVPFFSSSRGSAQRLPNGNTLISESDNGRVIEVEPTGEVVWEYYNPNLRLSKRTKQVMREPFYRFGRIDDPVLSGSIEKRLQ